MASTSRVLFFVAATGLLLGSPANAVPIVSLDVDPSTAGIQSSGQVARGTSFVVDVVVTGDGSTWFDVSIVAVNFNDAGSVLSLHGPPIAGSLAGSVPLARDRFGGRFVTSGDVLGFSSAGSTAPFRDGLLAGYVSYEVPFPATGTFTLFSLTFAASRAGTSILALSGNLGGPALSFQGGGVTAELVPASLTVVAGTVPAPGSVALLGAGGLALVLAFAGRGSSRKAVRPRSRS